MCERGIIIQFSHEQTLFLLEHVISEIGRAHRSVENACKGLSMEPGRLKHLYNVPCLWVIVTATFLSCFSVSGQCGVQASPSHV